jgi:hypothetical protein
VTESYPKPFTTEDCERIAAIDGGKPEYFTLTQDDFCGLDDLKDFLKRSEEIRNERPLNDLYFK